MSASTLEAALHAARVGSGDGNTHEARRCTVCVVLRHLDPGARVALESALGGILSGRAVHRALRDAGIKVSRESIIRHKNEAH